MQMTGKMPPLFSMSLFVSNVFSFCRFFGGEFFSRLIKSTFQKLTCIIAAGNARYPLCRLQPYTGLIISHGMFLRLHRHRSASQGPRRKA